MDQRRKKINCQIRSQFEESDTFWLCMLETQGFQLQCYLEVISVFFLYCSAGVELLTFGTVGVRREGGKIGKVKSKYKKIQKKKQA